MTSETPNGKHIKALLDAHGYAYISACGDAGGKPLLLIQDLTETEATQLLVCLNALRSPGASLHKTILEMALEVAQ